MFRFTWRRSRPSDPDRANLHDLDYVVHALLEVQLSFGGFEDRSPCHLNILYELKGFFLSPLLPKPGRRMSPAPPSGSGWDKHHNSKSKGRWSALRRRNQKDFETTALLAQPASDGSNIFATKLGEARVTVLETNGLIRALATPRLG